MRYKLSDTKAKCRVYLFKPGASKSYIKQRHDQIFDRVYKDCNARRKEFEALTWHLFNKGGKSL